MSALVFFAQEIGGRGRDVARRCAAENRGEPPRAAAGCSLPHCRCAHLYVTAHTHTLTHTHTHTHTHSLASGRSSSCKTSSPARSATTLDSSRGGIAKLPTSPRRIQQHAYRPRAPAGGVEARNQCTHRTEGVGPPPRRLNKGEDCNMRQHAACNMRRAENGQDSAIVLSPLDRLSSPIPRG